MTRRAPPWSGFIETTGDALILFEAAKRNLIPKITRRLVDKERSMIASGSVFVFDEQQSGIKRWTDGFYWSPSRILGNFLLYRETNRKGAAHGSKTKKRKRRQENGEDDEESEEEESLSRPKNVVVQGVDRSQERRLMGSLTNDNNLKFKKDGLMKKTFSMTIDGTTHHLISYYKIADVTAGRLRVPSTLPELASLDISPAFLDKANFRCPPKMEFDFDGQPRYRGESDEVLAQTGGDYLGLGFGSALPLRLTRATSNGHVKKTKGKEKALDVDELEDDDVEEDIKPLVVVAGPSRRTASRKRERSPTPPVTLKRAKVEAEATPPLRLAIPASNVAPAHIPPLPPPAVTNPTPTSSQPRISSNSLAVVAAAISEEMRPKQLQSASSSSALSPAPSIYLDYTTTPTIDTPTAYSPYAAGPSAAASSSSSNHRDPSWTLPLSSSSWTRHSLASYHTPFSSSSSAKLSASTSSLNAALVAPSLAHQRHPPQVQTPGHAHHLAETQSQTPYPHSGAREYRPHYAYDGTPLPPSS
ncbi:hypothetical protein HMN09_01193400 [Mycena chlorophos]|uniref:Uncharacterized protein n=1 Tax=Mycena chlorophos TaxID=658473 RepID=A0A8H6VYV0_MYCCL|nr:hypothetical protein HMN09_01193400 [Mycena chlorophos]